MDESTELSLSIAHIAQRLQGSHLHSQIERQAKDCLHRPEIRLESLKEDVRSFLKTSGWEKKLQNAVYRELHIQLPPSHPPAPPEHLKEPLAYMRKAQASWEKRILKSLNSMSTELGVPLARKMVTRLSCLISVFLRMHTTVFTTKCDTARTCVPQAAWCLFLKSLLFPQRPAAEQKELTNKWNEMGTDEPDLSRFRPVYAPKDFLEVLIGLRNPNHDSCEDISARSHWGLIQVPLNVRDIPHLRQAYSELNLNSGQLGIDDHAHDVMHYEQLRAGVIQHDLLVDNLIYKDVKLTASNDDYYFVFEDFLYQVLLCFSRDTAVLEHFKYNSATPPKSFLHGDEEYAVVYPPNGYNVVHVCVSYFGDISAVAPLCFLYNEPSKLYSVFREMYIRYFFRLHSISSSFSGIVSLCLQFERLLQTHLPQLFYHLRQFGAQPLRIAFKWMVRAFSGYLSTDQLLLLWDRILGYDSLEVVAVLAAAVFAFRAENLMEVTSLASAEHPLGSCYICHLFTSTPTADSFISHAPPLAPTSLLILQHVPAVVIHTAVPPGG
ncbi:hypothetical protein XENORESO_005227 [Xenotaenia resolanae]|uniref:Rab-GAP TBC domain-containing protein n=1 Tax=Xenotaenia resolanae TaxID=208358 RepID=A0ABV0X0K2_9TELE